MEDESLLAALESLTGPFIGRAPLPIIEVRGSAHLISYVNRAFCRLLGKTTAELVGKPFADVLPGGPICTPMLDTIYLTGEAVSHVHEDHAEPSRWHYAMWPTLDANEKPAGVIVQMSKTVTSSLTSEINAELLISGLRQQETAEAAEMQNAELQKEIERRKVVEGALHRAISDLKVARDATDRASNAKDEFLSKLSHELRTPLTPVLMTATALSNSPSLSSQTRLEMEMIVRNITLEARLIDDLLDLTKIVHGKLQFRAQPCNAHQLINFALEIVRFDAETKGVNLETELIAKQTSLLADPTRFQQVIWNLLRNAIKFTPAEGTVSIRSEDFTVHDEPWLRILVSDTGMGIESSQLDQIFTPFDQGNLTRDHRFGGVGLGLAIARAVVEQHGGRIHAESGGARSGATFIVEVPGNVRTQPTGVVSVAKDKEPIVSRRLLLVDDHVNTLEVLSKMLRRDGHIVTAVNSFSEAISAAEANSFDLVISDLGLPDGDGNDLMRKFREIYQLPGIALSGYGMADDVARSRDAGFATHLVKPVSLDDLRAAIARNGPV